MIRRLFQGFAAIAAVVLLAGFGAGAPIYNVVSSTMYPNPTMTMENVEKAIVRAGFRLGWQINPKGPGKIEGILNIRRHQAIIDITYDTKAFNITYKDSVNLDYSEKNRTIHSNYNGWIQNLEKEIRVQSAM